MQAVLSEAIQKPGQLPAPAISVLMPVFNARRHVALAVQSILDQSFGDFEFIIVDDGSTDGSTDLLRQFASEDTRIRLITRANTGYVRALNDALAVARGEFVARMDADDVAMPDRFARQIELMRANPELVLVGGATELIDAAGRVLLRPPVETTDEQLQAGLLDGNSGIGHPTAMLRRQAMIAVGGYDESMCPAEDLDLWLRLAEVGKLANLSQIVLQYRIHDKSVSSTRSMQQLANARRACESAWKRRGLAPRHFDMNRRWRADETRESRQEFLTKYGWWAWSNDERLGAMIYAARAIALMPFRTGGWRLLACALLRSGKRAT
jgi:glycosyltransferase involved in cell wall biosynthesis